MGKGYGRAALKPFGAEIAEQEDPPPLQRNGQGQRVLESVGDEGRPDGASLVV